MSPLGARLLFALLCSASTASAGEDPDFTLFESRIRPLLVQRCHGCHSGADKGI